MTGHRIPSAAHTVDAVLKAFKILYLMMEVRMDGINSQKQTTPLKARCWLVTHNNSKAVPLNTHNHQENILNKNKFQAPCQRGGTTPTPRFRTSQSNTIFIVENQCRHGTSSGKQPLTNMNMPTTRQRPIPIRLAR